MSSAALRAVGAVPDAAIARLARAAQLATLEDVLAWCPLHGAALVDVIVQDEFTHDVVVHTGDVFLCFDTT